MQWSEYPSGDPLRGAVRAAIEESSGEALSVNDSLPDELITAAQIEGVSLNLLHYWIYAGKEAWSAPAFSRWARAIGEYASRNDTRVKWGELVRNLS